MTVMPFSDIPTAISGLRWSWMQAGIKKGDAVLMYVGSPAAIK